MRKLKLRACKYAPTPIGGAPELGMNRDLSNSRAWPCSSSHWLACLRRLSREGLGSYCLLLSQAVLLADILPTLLIKLLAPLGLHLLPYRCGSGWQEEGRVGGSRSLETLAWRCPSEFLPISSQPPGACQWSLFCWKLCAGCLFSVSGVKPVW